MAADERPAGQLRPHDALRRGHWVKLICHRRKIITRINSYHGVTAVSASMTGKPYNNEFGLPLDGFIHAACPHFWKNAHAGESEEEFTKRMGEDLENIIQKEGPDTIAGFFAEPVMGAGGVIPPIPL